MKKIIVSLLAIVAISAAFAYPTLTGATGGFSVPNAKVAPRTAIAVNQYVDINNQYPIISLTLPIGDVLEFSSSYSNNVNGESFFNLGAKVAIPVKFYGIGLAVGGEYSRAAGYNELAAYASVGKELFGIDVTANYQYFEDSASDIDGFALSFNADKAVSDKINIGVDYLVGQSKIDNETMWYNGSRAARGNAYIRVGVADNFKIQGAVANLGQDAEFVLGGAYIF